MLEICEKRWLLFISLAGGLRDANAAETKEDLHSAVIIHTVALSLMKWNVHVRC